MSTSRTLAYPKYAFAMVESGGIGVKYTVVASADREENARARPANQAVKTSPATIRDRLIDLDRKMAEDQAIAQQQAVH